MTDNNSDLSARHARLLQDHDQLRLQHAELEQLYAEQAEVLRLRELQVAELTKKLKSLQKRQFSPTSEKRPKEEQDARTEANNEDIADCKAEIEAINASIKAASADVADVPETEEDLPEIDVPKSPKGSPRRSALPPELPRIDVYLEPESCVCGQCHNEAKVITERITEELEIDITLRVKRYIRKVYTCCDQFIVAPMPKRIIDKSFASPSLLAWVLTQKYFHHIPLYRIEQMSEQYGMGISRSTLADWVGTCGFHLKPLYEELHKDFLTASVIHCDETPFKVLRGKDGTPINAYVWLYRTGQYLDRPPIILHQLEPGRSGDYPLEFLAKFTGKALMVDQYSGYKKFFRTYPHLDELGCNAHARRKFFDVFTASKSPVASTALDYIGMIYDVERKATLEQASPQQRHELRQSLTRPILDRYKAWLLTQRPNVSDKSALAQAMDYTLNHWEALTRFLKEGTYPIDNNIDEQQAKRIAILRKNSLFAGSEESGRRACWISSLLATAQANGHDPYAWLTDVLTRLPNTRTKAQDIQELLPTHWKPGQPATQSA